MAAGRFRSAGVLGPARGRALPADQSHGDDLSDSARPALAGGRALALDPHRELPDEQPLLRLRMVDSARIALHRVRSQLVPAQLHLLPAPARADVRSEE